MFFFCRMTSASGVVGPLASSKIIFAWILSALSFVITFSRAAGASISQGSSITSSFVMFFAPGKSCTFPVFSLCAWTFGMSSPFSLYIPPFESDTAMTLNPSLCAMVANHPPTFPNPWIATLPLFILLALSASRRTKNPPCDVALSLPRLPPSSIGFPVMVPGAWCPIVFSYSSSIQDIVCPSVLTSGAGMSFHGPMCGAIAFAQPLLIVSNSFLESVFGSIVTPPFPPPYGIPATAHFRLIQVARAFTSSKSTCGWYLIPPLYGPLAELCWTLYPWYVLPFALISNWCTCSGTMILLNVCSETFACLFASFKFLIAFSNGFAFAI